jgi:hypothetical protein
VSRVVAFTVAQRASSGGSPTHGGSTADCLRCIDMIQVLVLERPDLAAPLLHGLRRLTATLRYVQRSRDAGLADLPGDSHINV